MARALSAAYYARAVPYAANSYTKSTEWHRYDCDDKLPASLRPRTRSRFDTAPYGADFKLNTADFDIWGHDFIRVPCPYQSICYCCGLLKGHPDAIFVAIDGACRDNGATGARSSYGVFFAESSPYNLSSIIQGSSHSSQKAELRACMMALRKVEKIRDPLEIVDDEPYSLKKVVLKSDSEYVVKGITKWLPKWKKNGFRTARGSSVVNAKLFKDIDAQIDLLDELGVRCLFWLVPRGENQEADRLANRALDEAGA